MEGNNMGEILVPDCLLTKVHLKNILSFKAAEFSDIGQLAVFIGPNNTGKSNLFRALQAVNFHSWVDKDFFYANADPMDAEILLEFTMSAEGLDKFYKLVAQKYDNLTKFENWKELQLNPQKNANPSNPTFPLQQTLSRFTIIIKFQALVPFLADLRFDGDGYENSIIQSNLPQDKPHPDKSKKDNLLELNWGKLASGNRVVEWEVRREERVPRFGHKTTREDLDRYKDDFITFYYFCGKFFDFIEHLAVIEENRYFDFEMVADLPEEGKINSSGQNLPQVLFDWRNNHETKFLELEKIVKEFYPNLSELRQHLIEKEVPVENEKEEEDPDMERHLLTKPEIRETPHNTTRYFDKVGKGMHQVLILMAHLLQLTPNSLLLIEEPELFLHPDLQKRLIEKIIAFLPAHQIFITSHSPFILNALPPNASLFRMQKDDTGASTARRFHPEEMGELFADLGIRPSDLLVNNGIIFVEGKTDAEIFKVLLADLIKEEKLEILTYSGKRHLVLTIIQEVWERLTKNNIRLLFILDGDEGNAKIRKELPAEQSKCLKILPVREIENFFLDPSILAPYLVQKYHDEFWDLRITSKEIKEMLNSFITEDLKLKTTIKMVFDKYLSDFTYSARQKFMKCSSKEEFLGEFVEYLKREYSVKEIDEGAWKSTINAVYEEVKDAFAKENWRRVPGKEMWKKVQEVLAKRKTPVNAEEILQMLPSVELCKPFLDEVKSYFQKEKSY